MLPAGETTPDEENHQQISGRDHGESAKHGGMQRHEAKPAAKNHVRQHKGDANRAERSRHQGGMRIIAQWPCRPDLVRDELLKALRERAAEWDLENFNSQ